MTDEEVIIVATLVYKDKMISSDHVDNYDDLWCHRSQIKLAAGKYDNNDKPDKIRFGV